MFNRIPVVWDMETGDPDDFLTLVLLCGHPKVNLRGVTVTPGGEDQIGLVRWALEQFGLGHLPVGAYNLSVGQDGKSRVSAWHYKVYGDIPPSADADPGYKVLHRLLEPGTTLITGAPLKNLGAYLTYLPVLPVGGLVVQGGFAGEGVIPPEHQLPKFKGMTTCPTYNLNGDVKGAMAMLAATQFYPKRLVGKHVCHGVYYDKALHQRVADRIEGLDVEDPFRKALTLIHKGMEYYLQATPEGKKFHDPVAACCAIDPSIGTWADVELYREHGQWGSRLSPGSGTEIITSFDPEKFVRTLLCL